MNYSNISNLLEKIIDLKYSEKDLKNAQALANTIAADLAVTPQEATTLLGYLLTRKAVKLVPGMGILPNPGHPDVQAIKKLALRRF